MRLIDADKLLLGRTENIYGKLIPLVTKNVIDNTPTVNAIPIPDGATNRDIIKELWHDETLLSNIEYCYGKEWLNAPYKESEEK